MEKLDLNKILADAVALAKNETGKAWKKVEPYAEHEFTQFAESVQFITQLFLAGKISEDDFKARLQFQKMALSTVLTTIEGIGIIAAQNVVNGVLDILRNAVQASFGLALPV